MKRIKKEWLCADCGKDTFIDPKDYYMVTCEMWDKYGLGGSTYNEDGTWSGTNSGMLCIDCLETRMGRKLEKKDLLPCPLNEENPYTSKLI